MRKFKEGDRVIVNDDVLEGENGNEFTVKYIENRILEDNSKKVVLTLKSQKTNELYIIDAIYIKRDLLLPIQIYPQIVIKKFLKKLGF